MIKLEQLDKKIKVPLISNLSCYGLKQDLYIEKTFSELLNASFYFIKAYITKDGVMDCQGYIYFFVDVEQNCSTYIGTYIKPVYRNMGLASLLTSSWINFCLENNLYNLKTNKKQKKPFLLYMLKTYGFELDNIDDYKTSLFNIHICKKEDSLIKYLFFENLKQRVSFEKGKTFKEDNYSIIDSLDNETEKLDTIILSNIYYLTDEDKAYQKSSHVLSKCKHLHKKI